MMKRPIIVHALCFLITLFILWRLLNWALADFYAESIWSGPENPPCGFMRLGFAGVVAAFLFTLQGWFLFRGQR
jgi:hypothetical protein